jgi:hypothetical protein
MTGHREDDADDVREAGEETGGGRGVGAGAGVPLPRIAPTAA